MYIYILTTPQVIDRGCRGGSGLCVNRQSPKYLVGGSTWTAAKSTLLDSVVSGRDEILRKGRLVILSIQNAGAADIFARLVQKKGGVYSTYKAQARSVWVQALCAAFATTKDDDLIGDVRQAVPRESP